MVARLTDRQLRQLRRFMGNHEQDKRSRIGPAANNLRHYCISAVRVGADSLGLYSVWRLFPTHGGTGYFLYGKEHLTPLVFAPESDLLVPGGSAALRQQREHAVASEKARVLEKALLRHRHEFNDSLQQQIRQTFYFSRHP